MEQKQNIITNDDLLPSSPPSRQAYVSGGPFVVSEEFVKHFDICNQFSYRHKEIFYKLKSYFLEKYCEFDGYDLQEFYKLYCFECCGTIHAKKTSKCTYSDGGCDASEVFSVHKHISSRYKVRFVFSDKTISENLESQKIYHCPTNEFFYSNYRFNSVRKSDNFKELELICQNKITEIKEKNLKPTVEKPFESLKWLIRECRLLGCY